MYILDVVDFPLPLTLNERNVRLTFLSPSSSVGFPGDSFELLVDEETWLILDNEM